MPEASPDEVAERQFAVADRMVREVEAAIIPIIREHRPCMDRNWSFTESGRRRLLVFKAWSLRYKVPYSFIFQELLTVFDSVAKVSPSAKGLGVSIETLTSAKAQAILEDAVQRSFPGGENETMWRQKERYRLAQIQITKEDEQHPMLYPDEYRNQIEHIRTTVVGAESRFPRAFRDNPFL